MPATTTEKRKLSKHWLKIITAIPKYDPFEQAGFCTFNEEEAQLALEFYPDCLVHIKGPKAGQDFELELWEKAIIANLFGWIRPDGTRRYREAFIYVPRKNGKTPFASGIILYGLLCDGESGAEVYGAAAEREQAKLAFAWVKGMIQANADLTRRTRIYQNSIVELDVDTGIETGSFYKPISAEAGTKHGFNSHIVLIDELHAQPNRELVDVLETSTAARLQPLIISITTADFSRASICNEKLDYARKVRDNVIEAMDFLPVIYEASIDDDWTDPKVWAKANPNLGVSVSPEYITAKCKKAQESSVFENTFKRLHLNIVTEQEVRWLKLEDWDKCKRVLTLKDVKKYPCYIGMDLASNTDLATSVRLFQLEDGYFAVFPRFYVPSDNAFLRERKDKVPYITWGNEGFIKLTEGNVIDYDFIRHELEQDFETFDVCEVAFDRWNFEALRQRFVSDGIPEHKMIAFGQGFVSLSAPTKELEKLVLERKIIHNNNPVLRWNASNVAVEIDAAANIKPSKKKSFEKIDGIVGLIMALGRAITKPPPQDSIYEDRGLTIL